MRKPTVQLTGEDGNAFSIIARVSKALKSSKQAERATEFQAKAMKCRSYDELLNMLDEYVTVQ